MSNPFGLYDKSYTLMIEALKKFPEIEKAIIFGSRSMGNYKKGSDIDLAIAGSGVTNQTVSRLSAQLNEELPIPYFIDVVDYNSLLNKELKEHIDRNGTEFYHRKKQKS